ncbi:hypothetical protein B0O79_3981 [Flavobacteriaceae bacterium MAR_2009_75]|nr:hypothetical protein B0O79_3981 [Flavobacteriaceae bacterium MAR_2009_75]
MTPLLENRLNKIRVEELLKPQKLLPRFYKKCKIKILVVIDHSIGFGGFGGFSLSEIFRIMSTNPAPYVDFEITKANRLDSDSNADLDGFRFDDHDLNQFSQIWMIAVEASTNALSDSELEAVSKFMDNGGGVFANGDHAALGNAICAKVPRVRSMRRWYYPDAGPNGEPIAPGSGADRIYTLTDDPNTPDIEQSQSDHVPQKIKVKYYSSSLGLFKKIKYPHPLLCSPKGIINIMPDHQHEGLVEVPSDLSQTWTFNGYSSKEYPSKSGHQEVPEVIARGTNFDDNTDFGMIATYNGHNVGVGRVVVDSTWHHWFDINLMGFKAAEDSVKLAIMNGMSPSAEDMLTMDNYELIKDYFRNIAVWLATPALQSCIRRRGVLFPFRDVDIRIILQQSGKINKSIFSKIQLGTIALDALQRTAPQCQVLQWVCWLVKDFRLREYLDPFPPFDPRKPKPLPDPIPFIELNQSTMAIMGGVLIDIFESYNIEDDMSDKEIDSSKFDKLLTTSAQKTIEQFVDEIGSSLQKIKSLPIK